ncbi:MAG: zinc ribbon domain-containing protein [Actinomycetota bacterium]|jgi:uncharacterized protein|nr:zinc ribbon domain-containing protein [Actinomycetota bacterium]
MNHEELLDAWPGVRIDHDNEAFYRGLLNRQLLVNRCDDCGHWHHPPRPVCPQCWSRAITPTEVEGEGFIAMFTILRQGARRPGIDYTEGHPLVAVELDEQPGLRVPGTIIGTPPTDIEVGNRVQMVWRDIDGAAPRPDFEVVR